MKKVSQYKGKNVLVIGLGKSGVNAAELLVKLGAKVTVNDKKTPKDLTTVNHLKDLGMTVITGSHPLDLLDNADLIVKNPGIPYDNVLVAAAVKKGIEVITEPELAYEISEAPMFCVTGSNGKTTTTTMITLMLNQNRKQGKAYAVGNIGVAASRIAQKAEPDDVLVTEISSFQLMGITKLHPRIAVLTNIYQAHTDWHKTHENYIKAKMRVTMNQDEDDYFVVNWDVPEARGVSEHTKAQVVPFSRMGKSTEGSYEKDGILYFRGEEIMPASEIKVPGSHNVENALAAIAVAKICGVSNESIIEVLKTFSGVRHRTQYVMTLNDRKIYNDSKATDIEATQKALDGFKTPVVLLAGGLDRGFTFDRLVPYFKKHVHALIVFGETADLMADAGKKAGIKDIVKTENAVTAVPEAYKLSNPGDIILLSPACASWDQWPTFEVRGDKFIEAVEKLQREVEERK